MDVNGVGAIVTGGASGLGAATARMLAANGAKVAIFDLNLEAGQALANEIGGVAYAVNVADDVSVSDSISAAQELHGPARVLINCAGIAPVARVVAKDGCPHSLDLFGKAVQINLVGTFNCISKFGAALIASKIEGEEAGVIINTASVAAFDGQIGQAAYAATKGGVVAMTLPIARDFAQHRIRVVTIAPGTFLTPMLLGLPQAAQDSLGQQTPHPSRLGRPEEYAKLCGSILDNPMLNGEVIRLDGAIRMAPR